MCKVLIYTQKNAHYEGKFAQIGQNADGCGVIFTLKIHKTMEILGLIIDFLEHLAYPAGDMELTHGWVWIPMAISALASAGSAVASASANKKNARKISAMEAENKADYLREYYRGALDNEGSKAYLKKLDDRLKRSDTAAENALTAQGATHENALAVKQANNQVYSDAVGNLVQQEQNRKDQARSQYKQGQQAVTNAQMQQNSNEAQTWAQVGAGISSAADAVTQAGGWEDLTNSIKAKKKTP